MSSRCATCNHPLRGEIDQALVDLTPLRDIKRRYGISTAALRRHRARHLSTELAKAFLRRAGDTFPRQDRATGPPLGPNGGLRPPLDPNNAPPAAVEGLAEVISDDLDRRSADRRGPDTRSDVEMAANQMIVQQETAALTEVESGLNLLTRVEDLRERTMAILDAAEEGGQPRTALKAIAQAADLLKLQGAFIIEIHKAQAEAPPTATEADAAWEDAGARIYGIPVVLDSKKSRA